MGDGAEVFIGDYPRPEYAFDAAEGFTVNPSIRALRVFVSGHVSAPYSSMERIVELYTRSLVRLLTPR